MARKIDRLSHRLVATIRTPGYHADGLGLYLYVDPPTDPKTPPAKRWVFISQAGGKRREMGLGSVHDLGLAEAREARDAARKLVKAGKNPIEERKLSGGIPTFGEVADELIETLKPSWRGKNEGQWKLSLQVHAKPIRHKPVNTVTTDDILGILKPIWTKIPETASRTRGRIERVLDAARAKGHIAPPWENPARWRGHLVALLPKRETLARGHHPAMPFDDVPAFMVDLRAREAVAARALELTILATTRSNETLGARRKEFDREAMVWTIPPERMKGKVEHRVPITSAMLWVIDQMAAFGTDPEGFMFPGMKKGRPLSNMAMEMLLRRMGQGAYSVHGFRSSFKDWAGECTSFADEISEQALAHVVGNKVRRAYRRGDALAKRRKLMEAWAGYLARPPAGAVVPMARPIP